MYDYDSPTWVTDICLFLGRLQGTQTLRQRVPDHYFKYMKYTGDLDLAEERSGCLLKTSPFVDDEVRLIIWRQIPYPKYS